MKFVRNAIPLALVVCFGAAVAHAQSGLDVYFGAGTMIAPSSGQQIDTFQTGNPYTTPRLGGAFGKVGADLMLNKHFGVGAQTDFRFSQGNYAGLKYRPLFYDFNAIWAPIGYSERRIVPEFQAGIGGARLAFYYPNTYCDQFAGCSSTNNFVESSNHFQVHMAAGVNFYVTHHLFIRPQVDARYVDNFFQFGSNWVPEYTGAVGWSFGSH